MPVKRLHDNSSSGSVFVKNSSDDSELYSFMSAKWSTYSFKQ